jgi:hypothetical protein
MGKKKHAGGREGKKKEKSKSKCVYTLEGEFNT